MALRTRDLFRGRKLVVVPLRRIAVFGEESARFHVRARLTDGLSGGSSLLFSALGDVTSKLSCWMDDY